MSTEREIRNKKICFFPSDLNPGGIGHLMINLARELVKRGFEVHFFLTERHHKIENEIPEGVKVFKSGKSVKGTFRGLRRYIKREHPYVIISARDSSNAVNVLACKSSATKTKAITSVHVDFSSDKKRRSIRDKIYLWAGQLIGCVTYRLADGIIAVSEGVADNHAKRVFVPRKRITVIYNPTFKEIKNPDETDAINYTANLQRPLLVGVGRLTEQKGFDILIRAFAQFKQYNKAGSLLILGEGEDRHTLLNLTRELEVDDSVFMPGYVTNPSLYIKQGDLFVFSSRWEGFGNVLVEALGVGAKIVSTNCKSGPVEILDNGKYGLLVPTNDPEAMSYAMETQISKNIDKEEQILRAKEFAVDKIATQYLKLIFE